MPRARRRPGWAFAGFTIAAVAAVAVGILVWPVNPLAGGLLVALGLVGGTGTAGLYAAYVMRRAEGEP